jgi:hypothetical protein
MNQSTLAPTQIFSLKTMTSCQWHHRQTTTDDDITIARPEAAQPGLGRPKFKFSGPASLRLRPRMQDSDNGELGDDMSKCHRDPGTGRSDSGCQCAVFWKARLSHSAQAESESKSQARASNSIARSAAPGPAQSQCPAAPWPTPADSE